MNDLLQFRQYAEVRLRAEMPDAEIELTNAAYGIYRDRHGELHFRVWIMAYIDNFLCFGSGGSDGKAVDSLIESCKNKPSNPERVELK